MSEMIEHVARALWDLEENTDCHDYDQLSRFAKRKADAKARAAIVAMREPTEAQLIAARDWSIGKYGKSIGNDGAQGCWQAMIDEALK